MSAAESSSASPLIQCFVKAPSGKITIELESLELTVLELKGLIAEKNPDLPADSQRLIYSGRVLKDEDPLSKYQFKSGNTIHLVKGARPAPPPAGASSAAQGVPTSFAAGQQIAGNPLAPLLNAQNAGALAGFNPFAQMGINPNDPNYMQTMMNDPAVQANVSQLLSDPAVVEQVIASNPELRAMGPQVRQLMQSEHFRSFLTNPESMRQMTQMMGGMGGGGPGAFPPPGAFGWGSGAPGAGATPAPAPALFNPWASTPPPAAGAAAQPPAAGTPGAFNPFMMGVGAGAAGAGAAGVGAAGGAQPDFARMMADLQALQGMGGLGAFGGTGGTPAAAPAGPMISPEERYAPQLEQLANMGFHDGARNVRALLASGGNVEGAVEYLFSNN